MIFLITRIDVNFKREKESNLRKLLYVKLDDLEGEQTDVVYFPCTINTTLVGISLGIRIDRRFRSKLVEARMPLIRIAPIIRTCNMDESYVRKPRNETAIRKRGRSFSNNRRSRPLSRDRRRDWYLLYERFVDGSLCRMASPSNYPHG